MKLGAPSTYTPEMAAKICSMMADGMSVREICSFDDMPAKSSVFKWLGIHKEFADQYVRAKDAQLEHMADEILDIADDSTNDWMDRTNKDGDVIGVRPDSEAIQRSKLRIDSRKWLLSKLVPKKYGDLSKVQHSGHDGGPLQFNDLLANITGEDEGSE